MSLYDDWILPPLLNIVMSQHQLLRYRRALVPMARGRVVDIGIGSGLNLPLYGAEVESVIGIDPSAGLLSLARRAAASAAVRAELLLGSATDLPLRTGSVDTVVMTWTLCSIPDPAAALREMKRVLRPGGALLFIEHGLSPEPGVARWQRKLTPIWRRLAGGCHLDRKVDELIRGVGFEIATLSTGYARGPRPMTFMYEGRAESRR
jgi:ubiquinone/menaquinone biosynthesis C-methylase UbiE